MRSKRILDLAANACRILSFVLVLKHFIRMERGKWATGTAKMAAGQWIRIEWAPFVRYCRPPLMPSMSSAAFYCNWECVHLWWTGEQQRCHWKFTPVNNVLGRQLCLERLEVFSEGSCSAISTAFHARAERIDTQPRHIGTGRNWPAKYTYRQPSNCIQEPVKSSKQPPVTGCCSSIRNGCSRCQQLSRIHEAKRTNYIARDDTPRI